MDKEYKYIDLNYLNSVSENIDFQKKIFSMFKDGISTIEVAMKKAIIEKNYFELAELVHKAKSNVSILGMVDQSNKLKKFELDLKEGKGLETYEERIQEFFQVCNDALKEIDDIEKSLL